MKRRNAHSFEAVPFDPQLPKVPRLLADLERRPGRHRPRTLGPGRLLAPCPVLPRSTRRTLGPTRDADADPAASDLVFERAQTRGVDRSLREEDDAREPGDDVQIGERLTDRKDMSVSAMQQAER